MNAIFEDQRELSLTSLTEGIITLLFWLTPVAVMILSAGYIFDWRAWGLLPSMTALESALVFACQAMVLLLLMLAKSGLHRRPLDKEDAITWGRVFAGSAIICLGHIWLPRVFAAIGAGMLVVIGIIILVFVILGSLPQDR